MFPTFIGRIDIQSWWEVPSIAHFSSLFSQSFNLPDFDIEDLEEALLTDGTEATEIDTSYRLLPELIVSLLKGCDELSVGWKFITTSNYQMFLRRLFRQKCQQYIIENPFNTDTDFQSLPLRTKLQILHCLCDFRLDSESVYNQLYNLESDSLRIEPLGFDENDSAYWYFYGTRLYREDYLSASEKKKRKKTDPNSPDTIWQVICFTEDDWNNLAAKFKNSNNLKERALYNILQENFLPKIPKLFKEKEAQRRRKLFQIRTSTRLKALAEQKGTDKIESASNSNDEQEIDDSDNKQKVSYTDRYQKEKLKTQQLKEEVRSKAKLDRQLRAARRLLDNSHGLSSENQSEHRDEKAYRPARRSRSSSLASIITTYASSSSTQISSDLIFQHNPNNNGNNSNNNPSSVNSSSLYKTFSNFSQNHHYYDCTKKINKIKEKFVLEDKENINTITLSSDENDDFEDNLSGVEDEIISMRADKNSSRKSTSGAGGGAGPPSTGKEPQTATKLPGRQTNNSLSSLTGNIVIQTPPTITTTTTIISTSSSSSKRDDSGVKAVEIATPVKTIPSSSKQPKDENSSNSTPRKKKTKTSEVSIITTIPTLSFTEDDEVLQIGMHKVLEAVKNHNDAWPFMDPVEEDIAPRYYSIIRRPMDLLKMEEKLDNGEYTHFNQFRNDFKLIVNNCRLYNGQENEYTEMVNNLQIAFEKATKKYFEQNSSDEEGILEYPELKTNVFREKYSLNKSSTLNSSSSSLVKDQPTTSTINTASNSSTINNSSPVKKPKHKNNSKPMPSSRGNNNDESNDDDIDDDIIDNKKSSRNIKNNQNNTNSSNSNNSNNSNSTKKSKKMKTDCEVLTRNKNEKISKDKDKIYPKGVKRKHKEKEKKKKRRKFSEHDSDIDDNHHHHNDNENESKIVSIKKLSKQEASPLQMQEHKTLKKLKQNLIKHKSKHKGALIGTFGSSIDKKLLKRELKKSRKGSSNKKIRSKKNNIELLVEHSDNNSDQGAGGVDYDDEDPKGGGFSSDQSVIDYPIKSSSNNNNNSNRNNSKTKVTKTNKLKDNKTSSILSSSSSKLKSKSASKLIVTSLNDDDDEDDLASISSHNLSHGPSPLPHSAYSSDNEMSSRLNDFNYDFETNEKISKTKHISLKPPTPDIKDKFDLIKERRRNNNSNCSSNNNNNNNQQDEKWNQIVKEAEKIQKSKSTLNSQNQKNKNFKLSETIEKLKMRNAKVSPNKDAAKQIKMTQKAEKLKKNKEKVKEPVKNSDTNKDEYDFTEDEPNTSMNLPNNNKKDTKIKENKVKENKVKENKMDLLKNKVKESKVKENKVKENKIKENKGKEKKVKEPKEKESPKPLAKDDKVEKLSKKNLMKKPNALPVNNKKNNTNVAVLDFETEQTLKDINKWLEHTPRFSEFSSASNSPSRYTLDEIETVPLNSKLDASEFKKSTPPYDTPSKATQPPPGKSKDPSDINKSATSPTKEIASSDKKTSTNASQGLTDVKPTINTNSAIVPPPIIPAGNLPGSSSILSANAKKELKESKRKLKEKLSSQIPRKRELQRTIDRLQPGKTKGNLISSIMNPKPTDELYPLGNLSKLKEIKNSLVVKTDDNGPKLSLGTVLNTENFGLVQQHNFSDDTGNDEISDVVEEPSEKKESIDPQPDVEGLSDNEEKKGETKIVIVPEATKIGDDVKDDCDIKEEKEGSKEVKKEPIVEAIPKEKPNATPNLSAWFKAFGAPKNNVQKKKDEAEEATNSGGNSTPDNSTSTTLAINSNTLEPPIIESIDSKKSSELISSLGSAIPATMETLTYSLPGQRQRKASTGSTISERSSFSQDPDSPRIGIDERLGQYPSTYPSPMGASPIMVSPKPDDMIPKTSPYPLNGAIKVGFYQDTTSKSSPDKSCSPRELPTPPYPNYSSHVYSSASPTGFNYGTSSYNPNLDNTAINSTRANYYEQYKQPHSQESDYNSSMSPTTNPTSPYQSQQSPFHQTPQQQQQNSPYQQNSAAVVSANTNSNNNQTGQQGSNSPYQTNAASQQQQPSSPFQPIQPQNTTKSINPISPHSPFSHSNHSSPYSQHDPNSPYSNSNNNGSNTGTSGSTGADISPYPTTNNATMSPKSGNQPTNSSKSNNISSQQLADWSTNNQPNNYTSLNLNTLSTGDNVVNNSQNNNQMQPQQPPQAHQAHKQQQPPQNLLNPYLHNIDNSVYNQNLMDKRNLLLSQQQNMFSVGNTGNQAGNTTEPSSCHMNDMINMGYNPPTKQKEQQIAGTDISGKKLDAKTDDQQQSFYEHLVGNMSYGKTGQPTSSSMPGFAKSITDISTSKAFDMYNKAANYPKTIPSTPSAQEMINMGGGGQIGYQTPQNTMNTVSQKLNESQLKQQLTQNSSGAYNLPIAAQQQQHQQLQNKHNLRSQSGNNTGAPSSALTDLVIPNPKANQDMSVNQNQAKLSGNPNQQLGMDLGSFKSFNTPSGPPMVDPALRNLASLSMMDRYSTEDRFLGLQGSGSGYYDNKISPSHMFPKPMQQTTTSSMQQMFGSSMANSFPYNREQQNPFSSVTAPRLQQDCSTQQKNLNINPVGMNLEAKPEKKPKKLGKKAQAAAAAAAAAAAVQSQTMGNQNISQQQMQGQSNQQVVQQVQQSQQGFQSYAGLKNTPITTEPTPISLKTSSVPGSAFNFGPTPTGLGLYGENSTYLDDYRGASNPYYIGTPHRSTPETSDDKTSGNNSTVAAAAAAAAASPYHQFLSHPSRASYPFVNSQLEPPNPAIYQQYVNNMLNQSLLGAAAAGAPPGTYPQSAYHPLMHKHYDAMNSMNRPWFP